MSDLIDREVAINALNILSEKMTLEGQTVMEQAIAVLNDIYSAEQTAKVEHVDLKNTQHWVFKCLECGQYFHKTSWGSPVKYCSRCGARLEWE